MKDVNKTLKEKLEKNNVNEKNLTCQGGSSDFLIGEKIRETIEKNFEFNKEKVHFIKNVDLNEKSEKIKLRSMSKGKCIVLLKDNGYYNSAKLAIKDEKIDKLLPMELGFAIKEGEFFIDGHQFKVAGTSAQDKLDNIAEILEKRKPQIRRDKAYNKDKIRKFAVFARNELLEKVMERALELENKKFSEEQLEEVAYTWFNRFAAIRFMEVNGYLDEKDIFKFRKDLPQKEAEEIFKKKILALCHRFAKIMPGIFKNENDYLEELFPDHLASPNSLVSRMLVDIEEEQWLDSVEIIGCLYQYYNDQKKKEIFKRLKTSKRINGKDLPVATELFTPKWIVKYMVENSLGKIGIVYLKSLGIDTRKLKEKWKFYEDHGLEDVPKVDRIEDIRMTDPCCGSGHILAYVFEVLMDVYLLAGYEPWQAAISIVENNIFAVELDKRAVQMAYFALMMKGRKYDEKFFDRKVSVNIYEIENCKEFENAKDIGSVLVMRRNKLRAPWQKVLSGKYHVVITNPPYMTMYNMSEEMVAYVKTYYEDSKHDLFAVFMEKAMEMAREDGLVAMVTQHSWMFLSCYENLRRKLLKKEIYSLIHLGTRAFEDILGDVVQTVAFVMSKKDHVKGRKGSYKRLVDGLKEEEKIQAFYDDENRFWVDQDEFRRIPQQTVAYWEGKEFFEAFSGPVLRDFYETKKGMFTGNNEYFLRKWYEVPKEMLGREFLPYNKGGRFRRWYGCNDTVVKWADNGREIKEYQGSGNINEDWFYKSCISWNLVSSESFAARIVEEGAVMGDGGPICVIEENQEDFYYLLGYLNSVVARNFMEALNPTMNYPSGVVGSLPVDLNKVSSHERCKIEEKVRANIAMSKEDWNSYETARGFSENSLMKYLRQLIADGYAEGSYLEKAYEMYKNDVNLRFSLVKKNHEDINRHFIRQFHLENSIKADEAMTSVTMTYVCDSKEQVPEELAGCRYVKYMEDVVVEFLSYIVGCLLGRFEFYNKELVSQVLGSLSQDVIYIDEDEDKGSGSLCGVNEDLASLVSCLLGKVTGCAEKELEFIKKALGAGPKKAPMKVLRKYFATRFYKDHLKMYGHRPIYLQFESGKKRAFLAVCSYDKCCNEVLKTVKCRLAPSKAMMIERNMVHVGQALEAGPKKTRRNILEKKLGKLREQEKEMAGLMKRLDEIESFDMEFDQGVVFNHKRFQGILSKI